MATFISFEWELNITIYLIFKKVDKDIEFSHHSDLLQVFIKMCFSPTVMPIKSNRSNQREVRTSESLVHFFTLFFKRHLEFAETIICKNA